MPIPSFIMAILLVVVVVAWFANNGAVVAFRMISPSLIVTPSSTTPSSSRMQPRIMLQRSSKTTGSSSSTNHPLLLHDTNHHHHHHHRSSYTTLHGLFDGNNNNNNNNNDDKLTTIPPDILQEITQAEANTPAAQARQQRILLYFALTLLGVTTAFFNAFLSSLRYGDGSPSSDLAYYGFEWVQSNWITGFLFTNKIGGGLGLLGAGLAGTLAEVEMRSKSEAIDKIWEEMQRRQLLREGGGDIGGGKNSNKKKKSSSLASSGQSSSKRQRKRRLSPLEELSCDEIDDKPGNSISDDQDDNSNNEISGGMLGAISRFYKQADNMAASQALLLNKELEDRGILEKITDETGLRVVGKGKNKEEVEEEEEEEG